MGAQENIAKDKPYLLNVSSDPILNGTLAWQLDRSDGGILLGSDKERDKVGGAGAGVRTCVCCRHHQIVVVGLGIPEGEPLCKFVVSNAADQHTTVEVLSDEGVVTVNGLKVNRGEKPTKL